jgi:hypothetical protein
LKRGRSLSSLTNPEQITSRATIAQLRAGAGAKPAAAKAKRVAAPTVRAKPAKKR